MSEWNQTPWPQRFMCALPPIPDRAVVLGFMAILVLVGLMLGTVLCRSGHVNHVAQETSTRVDQSTLHLRLGDLEQRVKALEDRQR